MRLVLLIFLLAAVARADDPPIPPPDEPERLAVIFDRSHGRLLAFAPEAHYFFCDSAPGRDDTAPYMPSWCYTVKVEPGNLYLSYTATCWEPDSEGRYHRWWRTLDLRQDWTGAVTTVGGEWGHWKAFAPSYDALLAERTDIAARLAEFFELIGQPEMSASARVFAVRDGDEAWTCDGETARACEYYLPCLDDPDWRVRQEATLAFLALGDDAALWLWQQQPADLSLEQQTRVAVILRTYPL